MCLGHWQAWVHDCSPGEFVPLLDSPLSKEFCPSVYTYMQDYTTPGAESGICTWLLRILQGTVSKALLKQNKKPNKTDIHCLVFSTGKKVMFYRGCSVFLWHVSSSRGPMNQYTLFLEYFSTRHSTVYLEIYTYTGTILLPAGMTAFFCWNAIEAESFVPKITHFTPENCRDFSG